MVSIDHSPATPDRLPLTCCFLAVLIVTASAMAIPDAGEHTQRMAAHIVLMNALAPLIIAAVPAKPAASPRLLWGTSLMQLAALALFHLPAAHDALGSSPLMRIAGDALLFFAASAFWYCALTLPLQRRWQAIAALLITGKCVCLLAALLVFAPRPLYGGGYHHAAHPALAHAALADQQLAGLVMITACPVSYVATALVLTLSVIHSAQSQARAIRPG